MFIYRHICLSQPLWKDRSACTVKPFPKQAWLHIAPSLCVRELSKFFSLKPSLSQNRVKTSHCIECSLKDPKKGGRLWSALFPKSCQIGQYAYVAGCFLRIRSVQDGIGNSDLGPSWSLTMIFLGTGHTMKSVWFAGFPEGFVSCAALALFFLLLVDILHFIIHWWHSMRECSTAQEEASLSYLSTCATAGARIKASGQYKVVITSANLSQDEVFEFEVPAKKMEEPFWGQHSYSWQDWWIWDEFI